MKKISKKILLATLGIAGFATITPVILTSCSISTNSPTNPDNPNNPDNPSTTKVVPEVANNIETVGSVADLFDNQGQLVNVGELFNNKVNSSDELKKQLITNYDKFTQEQKDNTEIKISTETPSGDLTWGGTTPVATWNTAQTEVVYYDINSPEINVSSAKDLKTKLDANKLKEIMSQANRADAENMTYSLVETSQIGLDANKDYVNINVNEAPASGTAKSLNLKLPVSDLNLVVDSSKVSIVSKNPQIVESKEATITLDYNIGIDSKVVLPTTFNKAITLDSPDITPENVVTKLGFVETAVTTTSSTSAINLNSDFIGQTTQIFNTTFANPTLNENNTTLYFDATPTTGHYWIDGTNTTKQVAIEGLTITPGQALPKDAKFASSFTLNNPYNTNKQASLEQFKIWYNSNNTSGQKIGDVINQTAITAMNADTANFANVTFTYKGDDSMLWDATAKKPSIVFTVTPQDQHAFEDNVPATHEVTVLLSGVRFTS